MRIFITAYVITRPVARVNGGRAYAGCMTNVNRGAAIVTGGSRGIGAAIVEAAGSERIQRRVQLCER